MPIPEKDDQGHPLLSESEFHRLHMMEPAEFDALDDDLKTRYAHTQAWSFQERMGDLDPDTIQTGSGKTYREMIDYHAKMKSQTGK